MTNEEFKAILKSMTSYEIEELYKKHHGIFIQEFSSLKPHLNILTESKETAKDYLEILEILKKVKDIYLFNSLSIVLKALKVGMEEDIKRNSNKYEGTDIDKAN